ncbi:MAG TPA: transglycosylase SLT domain-containing protein [Acidobacteriota bacterium]|nr:transglycosylase SLT domain-containing protein [Acidobacteriota bacterium]
MRRTIMISGICLLAAAVVLSWLHLRTMRFDFLISQAAARHGIDFYLAKSLIYEESWFRPESRGPAGELGLMQITRAAAADFAAKTGFPEHRAEQLIEPGLNVEIGCWYLRNSLEHYKDSPHPVLFALLRYNAGESRANNWLRLALASPPPPGVSPEQHYLSLVDYKKTRAYVTRILKRYRSRNFLF